MRAFPPPPLLSPSLYARLGFAKEEGERPDFPK